MGGLPASASQEACWCLSLIPCWATFPGRPWRRRGPIGLHFHLEESPSVLLDDKRKRREPLTVCSAGHSLLAHPSAPAEASFCRRC